MKSVKHPDSNIVLTLDGANDLHAERTTFRDKGLGNVPGFETHWKPDADELEALNNGKTIRLTVIGTEHPPVSIGVGDADAIDVSQNGGGS